MNRNYQPTSQKAVKNNLLYSTIKRYDATPSNLQTTSCSIEATPRIYTTKDSNYTTIKKAVKRSAIIQKSHGVPFRFTVYCITEAYSGHKNVNEQRLDKLLDLAKTIYYC